MWLTRQRKNFAKAVIDHAIHEVIRGAERDSRIRLALERLLRHVQTTTGLLRLPTVGGRIETQGIERIVGGLLALACHHTDWVRPIEDWNPTGQSPMPQFGSLAMHLLARYPVPAFMTSVWLRDRDAESHRYQGWYKHIGLGRNIRTADLPLLLTKMMAHHFMLAPDHYTVEAALRWGQVRGMGGSEELAGAVAATQLGRSFEHEDFWKTVIQFFVNEPTLDSIHIGPIVDYLNSQKFVPQEDFLEEGELGRPGPPQPNLTMKGRTKGSLLRLVEEWHKSLRHRPKVVPVYWERSGIGELRFIEKDSRDHEPPRTWTIQELLSSGELYREGLAMQHCVASYVRAVLDGRHPSGRCGSRTRFGGTG